ncbi:YbhB/YbcL family Raf kinase inhibitor-like protein [Kamptonema formosum]|uniref:YbhB/YbcL family Raf kinase inhibitor-like protein n=1 Tax=Kamptonema formosum TaxID=331992 RepID=UPI000378E272|nr:YbhB/YbcL family Raf kinase inhibitor-like protein [Oscillatoria sp. PCC 10802]
MTGRRAFLQQSASLFGLVGLSLAACSTAGTGSPSQPQTATTMKLHSTAFDPNNLIPAKHTCDGQDISPPLSWDDPPAGAKSLALICDDPDASRGSFIHWLVYDLPALAHQLPEGVPKQPKLATGGVQGKNDFGSIGYGGPCPPTGTHRYVFKLYALDKQLGLQPGATKAQVLKAIEGHNLGTAELIGRYARSR